MERIQALQAGRVSVAAPFACFYAQARQRELLEQIDQLVQTKVEASRWNAHKITGRKSVYALCADRIWRRSCGKYRVGALASKVRSSEIT